MRRAQSTLEYSVLIAIVAAAIATMHTYVQRSVQANLKTVEGQVNASIVHYALTPGGADSSLSDQELMALITYIQQQREYIKTSCGYLGANPDPEVAEACAQQLDPLSAELEELLEEARRRGLT